MNGWRQVRFVLLFALAVVLRADEKPAGETPRSGNWLVDAMDEKSARSPADSTRGSTPDESSHASIRPLDGSHADGGAVNPLANYLGAWMTPHDLEVLKLKDTNDSPAGLAVATGRGPKATAGLNRSMPPNPYLADLVPAAPAPAKAPPAPPTSTAPAPASLAAKNDAPPAKPPGPPAEVRKSQDDAKYFPQLKRF